MMVTYLLLIDAIIPHFVKKTSWDVRGFQDQIERIKSVWSRHLFPRLAFADASRDLGELFIVLFC